MSETLSRMAQKIRSASELSQVVRTMKTLAAVNIPVYERAVAALSEYERAIELGLVACFHDQTLSIARNTNTATEPERAAAIVFGSDQGLVSDFNERLAVFSAQSTRQDPAIAVWPVGDRIFDELSKQDLAPETAVRVPDSVAGISSVISQLLANLDLASDTSTLSIRIFHNQPTQGHYYEPVQSILLPLDQEWLTRLRSTPWPTRMIPQVFNPPSQTWSALIREYLFVHLFRACAESLASENVSRFASMQRAEKNIRELIDQLQFNYNQQRQNSIDEELFDVVFGAEASSQRRADRHTTSILRNI
ncbi:MAG: F0F1 ATP synthase subunit gamma [Limisphaerales bacterium]